jgi:sugar/nucleoside kinase (ribokinase family)
MALDLVVVGHVTVDRTPHGLRPGGALYAVSTARRLGLGVGLLTSFGPDFPEDQLPAGVEVATVASSLTTVFELDDTPDGRRLRLVSRAADLEAGDLPAAWRHAPLALLCPVAAEVDPGLAESFPDASLGVTPQGWMRERQAGGLIAPRPWEDADVVLAHAQMVVASEEDVAPFREDTIECFQRVPLAALTAGARGATLFVNGEPYHVAPDPAAEVDPTGAGDVFAAALLVSYYRGGEPWEAADAAACAAAASVGAVGVDGIPDAAALAARIKRYRARRGG